MKVLTAVFIIIMSLHCIVRLAASNEPHGTDHTGEITSFTDVGPGNVDLSVLPRPWVCYTRRVTVEWQLPNGDTVVRGSMAATGDQLITRIVHRTGFVLSRGPTHNSPDGEHCCVETTTNERRCVIFSEYYINVQCWIPLPPPQLPAPH